jgi:signal peptidase I
MKILNKSTIDELKSISYIVIIALAIRTFIFEPYYVPSSSMYDNLQVGDYIVATKYSYGFSKESFPFSPNIFSGRILKSEPKRGDIIVFRAKNTQRDVRYIKRLIGLPGDKIQLINGNLYINDTKIKREYIGEITNEHGDIFEKFNEVSPEGKKYTILGLKNYGSWESSLNNTPIFYVPEGKYFFLGDNRDQSRDSRFEMGFVENEELIAKAQFIFFSNSKTLFIDNFSILDQIKNIWPWIKSIRLSRIFTCLY